MVAVDLGFILDDLALEGYGELLNYGSIDLFALYGGQAAAGKLIGHGVARSGAEEVGFLYVRNIGNAQRECAALFDVFRGLVTLADVKRHHVFGTDAAPGHVHHVNNAVLAVGCYHKHRHREQIRIYAQIFFHYNYLHT